MSSASASTSSAPTAGTPSTAAAGRGRGKSRGGLGKYLRARGRGRRGGRPAEFSKRLVLEDEELVEVEPDSEVAKELARKYAKRHLGSNADRYKEPEPVLNSDGEVEEEPEADLSSFLARQRLHDGPSYLLAERASDNDDDDDVDHSLAHLAPTNPSAARNRKGKTKQIEWDEELEVLSREKAVADANRDLKSRFRETAEKKLSKPTSISSQRRHDKKSEDVKSAPPLPSEIPPKTEKEELQDFLDDLLG